MTLPFTFICEKTIYMYIYSSSQSETKRFDGETELWTLDINVSNQSVIKKACVVLDHSRRFLLGAFWVFYGEGGIALPHWHSPRSRCRNYTRPVISLPIAWSKPAI